MDDALEVVVTVDDVVDEDLIASDEEEVMLALAGQKAARAQEAAATLIGSHAKMYPARHEAIIVKCMMTQEIIRQEIRAVVSLGRIASMPAPSEAVVGR